MTRAVDIDDVTAILWEAAQIAVMPRFRALPASEIEEKAPGELVTVADREAETIISRRLAELLPGAGVVGEEACAQEPGLVNRLADTPWVWLVDPLDGTANFVAGSANWAIMVALIRSGDVVAAWIVLPADNLAYAAERGSGAWRGGQRLHATPASPDPGLLRGAVLTRFLDPTTRAAVDVSRQRFGAIGPGTGCAGIDYALIVEGKQDFVFFQRLLPWDHAPGTLLLTEAGATARRLDGSEYRPAQPGSGLLAASDALCWQTARSTLPL